MCFLLEERVFSLAQAQFMLQVVRF